MPPSGDKPPPSLEEPDIPGVSLAVWAEVLYLCNLLLLPGICFAGLVWLYFKHRAAAPALALCHLKQAVSASLWAGALLVVVTGIVIMVSDYHSEYTWVVVILYLVSFHTSLVLLGILGLAKAMAGKRYVYPLIGRPCG